MWKAHGFPCHAMMIYASTPLRRAWPQMGHWGEWLRRIHSTAQAPQQASGGSPSDSNEFCVSVYTYMQHKIQHENI